MLVAVYFNGQELWSGSDSGIFNIPLEVTAGDIIDFAVYGGYGYGNTPISVIIGYLK